MKGTATAAAELQVATGFYDFSSYVTLQRWTSYWYQLNAVLRYKPRTVLEIGAGFGATTETLRRAGVQVTTFDYDASLGPDLVGDVRRLSDQIRPGSFDLVCAFQVLEHLPFEDFPAALQSLKSTAKSNVIVSLPHWGYPVELRFRFLKNALSGAFARKLVRPKRWEFDGQHYWELGTKGHGRRQVAQLISRELRIERQYFCPDYSYHYFFECAV